MSANKAIKRGSSNVNIANTIVLMLSAGITSWYVTSNLMQLGHGKNLEGPVIPLMILWGALCGGAIAVASGHHVLRAFPLAQATAFCIPWFKLVHGIHDFWILGFTLIMAVLADFLAGSFWRLSLKLIFGSPETKGDVVCEIARKRDPRVVGNVLELLEDSDPGLRDSAVIALGYLKNTETVGTLINVMFNDSMEYVRLRAAESLLKIGDASISATFKKALKDKSESMREYATVALEHLDNKTAMQPEEKSGRILSFIYSEVEPLLNIIASKDRRYYRCPNCECRIEKDNALLWLCSGVRVGGPGVGSLKETVYCPRCNGPVNTEKLLSGEYDPHDYGYIYIALWICGTAFLMLQFNLGFWAALGTSFGIAVAISLVFSHLY